jgi:hypothetical protein
MTTGFSAYRVAGLGGLGVRAGVGDVSGLSTLVTGRGTGGRAGSGLVGGWMVAASNVSMRYLYMRAVYSIVRWLKRFREAYLMFHPAGWLYLIFGGLELKIFLLRLRHAPPSL